MKDRSKPPYPTSMPVGEEVMIDDTPTYVHHMDDQGSWENDPILHPQFIPDQNPKKENGRVYLVIHMTHASVIVSRGNTDKTNQFIAAVTTRPLDGRLMVIPTRSASLRVFQKWFLHSKTTANEGWDL